MRIPTQTSRRFRRKPATDSDASQPPLRGRVAARFASSQPPTARWLSSDRGAPCQARDCQCVRFEKSSVNRQHPCFLAARRGQSHTVGSMTYGIFRRSLCFLPARALPLATGIQRIGTSWPTPSSLTDRNRQLRTSQTHTMQHLRGELRDISSDVLVVEQKNSPAPVPRWVKVGNQGCLNAEDHANRQHVPHDAVGR